MNKGYELSVQRCSFQGLPLANVNQAKTQLEEKRKKSKQQEGHITALRLAT